MKKCYKCGTLTDCPICFTCSGEKNKTIWRRKYKKAKRDNVN